MRFASWLSLFLVLTACGDDDRPATDAGGRLDAGTTRDAGELDGGLVDAGELADAGEADGSESTDAGTSDAGTDPGADAGGADAGTDAGSTRRSIGVLHWCPDERTEPGLYRGTLADLINDIGAACSVSAPGGEASLRVDVPAGATLRAVYRHAADGVLYLLDRCGAAISCLVGVDASSSGAETLTWTNTSGTDNEVFLFLDSFELFGAQTFELDLFVE